jgi:Holliday junction DNA helicase RuvA
MIVSLNGTLIESGFFRAVIECAGVGYEVAIPVTTAERLPAVGKTARLHTLQIFREDAQSLYGFADVEERDFFRLLIEKVNGIGPKSALNIFSKLSLQTLKEAIARGDVKLLSGCPGIGKKTAERLVIELRDKIVPTTAAGTATGGTGGVTGRAGSGAGGAAGGAGSVPIPSQDAVAALVSLGYKLPDADKAVRQAIDKLGADATAEALIRAAFGN